MQQMSQPLEPVFLGNDISFEELITRYSRQGFVDEKILLFLSSYDGIHTGMSLRTFKTKLNFLGLQKRRSGENWSRKLGRLSFGVAYFEAPGHTGEHTNQQDQIMYTM